MNYDHLKQPLVLIIFGITGDLSQRKLLPALYQLAKAGDLPQHTRIIGVSRRDTPAAAIYTRMQEFTSDPAYDATVTSHLIEQTEMFQMDLLDTTAYERLLLHIRTVEAALGNGASRLYYLSIPSQAFQPIIRLLGQTGHNAPVSSAGDAPRLLIEKPFGYDLTSAQELVNIVDEHFGEGQVYRIDHYIAKETVQNLLTFRFQNPLFEAVWNNRHIESIRVVAHEKIGIEGRVQFYEQTGALRDLVQSHLLQLLAMTTMDKPARLESDAIHASKLALLQAIPPIAPDMVHRQVLRAQYQGYRDEVQNPDSTTETFAHLQLAIDTDTWRGVAITLESGKALNEKLTEITVCFKQQPDATYEKNQLIFRIQPQEGITLRLQTKRPGIYTQTETADMTFDYAHSFNERPAEAYERVIVDAIRGDQTLFASADEVLASWRIIEHILEQWSHGSNDLQLYPIGSTGPTLA